MDFRAEIQQLRTALECIKDVADIRYALQLLEQLEEAAAQLANERKKEAQK